MANWRRRSRGFTSGAKAMTYELNRRRFLRGVGVAGASLAGALAPASHGWGASPVRGGTITLATVDTPVNLDPQDLELSSSIQVYDNIFGKLIELDLNY